MARFPYYAKNTAKLGKILAKASLDPAFAEKLDADPASALKEIGLPAVTTELINFKIVDAKSFNKVRVIPYKLSMQKICQRDAEYLTNVANLFS